MNDAELQMFSESLCSPNFQAFVEMIKSTIDKKIFKFLQEHSKFSLDRWRLVGGLAKKTSTLLKADADIVVFYNDEIERKRVLNDFHDILLIHTSLTEDDMKISKNEVMQFELDGIPIDLLATENNFSNHTGTNVIEEQRKNSLLKVKQSGLISHSIIDKVQIKDLSFDLSESSVEFMKKQSKFVHDVARLAKYWNQVILFKHYVHGRSMVFELLGTQAALEEEQKYAQPSISRAFKRFLKMVCYIRTLNIVFPDYYKRSEIPFEVSKQIPLLMDPVNPYNNLLNLKKEEHLGDLFEVFEYAAGSVLKMIGNGCSDIDLIFCPQPLLYHLRLKEEWFLPREGTYLVGVTNSNVPWIKKATSSPLMPDCIIRDPKGRDLKNDFKVALFALAGYIHNVTGPVAARQKNPQLLANKGNHIMTDREIMNAAKEFIDKNDGVKRNWISGNDSHERKAVTLTVPFGKCSNDGVCRVLCLSFDFHIVSR